jgi:hypothetical protein
MQVQEKHRGLNWIRPGKREVKVVGTYISKEGPGMHEGFGGSSQLDVEQAKFVLDLSPHQRLERALQDYINESMEITVTKFDDSLCDKIAAMEKSYTQSRQGLWHRLWYGMADNKDIVEAWVDLIPDDFGLSVIKAGVAIIFKLAENSKGKQEKVFKTFSTLQETLLDLRPDRARFRNDSRVRECASSLFDAVVKSIEDMVIVLSATEPSRCRFLPYP